MRGTGTRIILRHREAGTIVTPHAWGTAMSLIAALMLVIGTAAVMTGREDGQAAQQARSQLHELRGAVTGGRPFSIGGREYQATEVTQQRGPVTDSALKPGTPGHHVITVRRHELCRRHCPPGNLPYHCTGCIAT